MLKINRILKNTEKLISDATGFKIRLKPELIQNLDRKKVLENIKNQQNEVYKLCAEKGLYQFDSYYISLLIIDENFPFISHAILAKAFEKDTSTICKALANAKKRLNYDVSFTLKFNEVCEKINK
jgi:hypothetical protein